jgi:4a-hydroxytetrahydrobiopterin dehydratase
MHHSGSASLSLRLPGAQRLQSLPQSSLSNLIHCRSCRPSCGRWGRTKLTAKVACLLQTRPERSFALHPPYAPHRSFKDYSTSQATPSTDKRQATSTKMSDDIIFSVGQPTELPERASKLLSTWELTASRKGITRQYTFSSFSKAWNFMSVVADECKLKKHHPSWSNLYNKVTVEWTTHRPEGFSIKDVEMAEFCDRTANEIGLKA